MTKYVLKLKKAPVYLVDIIAVPGPNRLTSKLSQAYIFDREEIAKVALTCFNSDDYEIHPINEKVLEELIRNECGGNELEIKISIKAPQALMNLLNPLIEILTNDLKKYHENSKKN